MKTIGFIDFFLNEWHANEYPAMIKSYNEKNGTDYQVKYAWAETDGTSDISTEQWCKNYDVERCFSIEELCEKSDYVIVLSPSNPEKHLEYAEKVFKCGKSPYIDKTFAPDYETAKKIYDLAEKYNVKFFTSSALRYADEIKDFSANAKTISTVGGGSNMDEYIIHQIEMVVKCLGVGAKRVRYTKHADQEWAEVDYDDERHATMMFAPCMPIFAAIVANDQEKSACLPIASSFFDNLIADIIHFFESGKTSFESQETLEVMKIREFVIKGKAKESEWLSL